MRRALVAALAAGALTACDASSDAPHAHPEPAPAEARREHPELVRLSEAARARTGLEIASARQGRLAPRQRLPRVERRTLVGLVLGQRYGAKAYVGTAVAFAGLFVLIDPVGWF
mgnify:CR=1 FL=1